MVKAKRIVDEKGLMKGKLRKLRALRKWIGAELADETFAKWYAQERKSQRTDDPNIELIEKALQPLTGKVRIPRKGAYAIRRGRGRFIVELIELT